MYPSLESFSLVQLEQLRFWLKIIGLGVALAAVLFAFWWNGFRNHIDARIAYLNKIPTNKKIDTAQATAEDAKKNTEQIPVRTGALLPGNEPMPEVSKPPLLEQEELSQAEEEFRKRWEASPVPQVPEGATALFLGNATVVLKDFPFFLFRSKDRNGLTITSEDGGLLLSAEFFDEHGDIVCEIIRNEFHLNVGKYFRIDDSLPHTLTVKGHQNQEVCKVEFLNKHAIRITGDFYASNGQRVVITRDAISMGGSKLSIGFMSIGAGWTIFPIMSDGTVPAFLLGEPK